MTAEARNRETAIVAAAVFVLTLVIYILLLPPTILPGDSGELVAASRTLSIAHTPGSPLYLMLGKLFSSALPVGSMAYRYNLLSAVFAALAVALLYRLLRNLGVDCLIAAGVTLALAVKEIFWLQAVEAEVYAMGALLTVLLFYIAFMGKKWGDRAFVLLAFVGGVSVSHHTALVYAFVAALLLMLLGSRRLPGPGALLMGVFMLLLGASLWIYIPVRASQHPPLTWGETQTLDGFVSHVLGRRYGWRLKPFEPGPRLGDMVGFLKMVGAGIGIPLVLLSVAGLVTHIRRYSLAIPLVCLVLFYAVHSAVYQTHDIEGHVVPAVIGLAVFAGLGAQYVASAIKKRTQWAAAVVAAGVLIVFIIGAVTLTPRQDEWLARDFAVAVCESAIQACGEKPIIMASGEFVGLPLLYAALVEGYEVTAFAPGTSDPSLIGGNAPIESLDEAIIVAGQNYGASRIAVLAGSKAASMGGDTRICGMVYALYGAGANCPPPRDYTVRGVGKEMRDYYSRVLSAEYLLHLSRYDITGGDTESARANLDRVAELACDDAITNVEASRLYFEVGDPERAEDLIYAALEAEPDYFYAHFALANVHSMNGRYDDAIAEYRKALRGNPEPGIVHVNLGNTYRTKADYARALDHYEKALDLDEKSLTANLGIGATLEAMARYDEALEYLDRALAADDSYSPAVHAKAALLMRLGRGEEALQVLEAGLAANPAEPLLLSDAGLYYLRAGDLDSAIHYLERALEISPALLTARGNLAVAYERNGNISKAAEQYGRYVEDAPPGPGRERAAAALRALED
ncbi:MAG: tetratricopeptide repeat protein [bacterium]